ncbi:MAG: hypothetical protein LBU73_09120 [Helicobacteraceae bacterium]|jgi:outer membrane cobalamin receptor|nr:hypothetical protein [Helicobacteraceae bacterium]
MKQAKGFKKRYFSLAAITALNAQLKNLRDSARADSREIFTIAGDRESESAEEKPPLIAALAITVVTAILPAPAAFGDDALNNANSADFNASKPPIFIPKEIKIAPKISPNIEISRKSAANLADRATEFSAISRSAATQIPAIEGAPQRFSAVFWEGINIADAVGADRHATQLNYLAIGGDLVGAAFGGAQSELGAGSSGALFIAGDRAAPNGVSFGFSDRGESWQNLRVNLGGKGYIAASKRDQNSYTAIAKSAGELDKTSKKDAVNSYNFRGVFASRIGDFASAELKFLDAHIIENYDGWNYITNSADPNDDLSKWKSRIEAYEINAKFFAKESAIFAIGANESKVDRKDKSAGDQYISHIIKPFFYADMFFNNNFEARIGAEESVEKGEIKSAFSPMKGENVKDDIYAIFSASFDRVKFDLSLRNTNFNKEIGDDINDYSYRANLKFIFNNFSFTTSESRSINAPNLSQLLNPYGTRSPDLKYEIFDQTRIESEAEFDKFDFGVALWNTRIKDYINWVNTINWSDSYYNNIDRVKFSGLTIKTAVKPTADLAINAEITRLFDYGGSEFAKSVKDRQSKQTILFKTRYNFGEYYFFVVAKFGESYLDSASGENMKGERKTLAAIGYENSYKTKVEFTVKNIFNEYRESVYGYTPDDPERSFIISAEQKF